MVCLKPAVAASLVQLRTCVSGASGWSYCGVVGALGAPKRAFLESGDVFTEKYQENGWDLCSMGARPVGLMVGAERGTVGHAQRDGQGNLQAACVLRVM